MNFLASGVTYANAEEGSEEVCRSLACWEVGWHARPLARWQQDVLHSRVTFLRNWNCQFSVECCAMGLSTTFWEVSWEGIYFMVAPPRNSLYAELKLSKWDNRRWRRGEQICTINYIRYERQCICVHLCMWHQSLILRSHIFCKGTTDFNFNVRLIPGNFRAGGY